MGRIQAVFSSVEISSFSRCGSKEPYSALPQEMADKNDAAENAILDTEVIVETQSYDLPMFASAPAKYSDL